MNKATSKGGIRDYGFYEFLLNFLFHVSELDKILIKLRVKDKSKKSRKN